MFDAIESHELSGQFISDNIPSARCKPSALVAFEEDEPPTKETSDAFVLFCHKFDLCWDDFPAMVRQWDHVGKIEAAKLTAGTVPINWDDAPDFLRSR